MGELYGEINLETQDWMDGLASKILRKFAQNATSRRSWCIFDGPVDALWVENMNSVLDDNMMLSLMNGERIKLNSNIRILFEVMDLAVASPATVSRCGMVYLSPQDLPWRPIFQTWMSTYIIANELLNEKQQKYLTDLFDAYLDQTFEKVEQFADQE
jgi:dynein heavy chain